MKWIMLLVVFFVSVVRADTLDFIKKYEGFSSKPYFDVSRWSIGYGTKSFKGEAAITKKMAENRLQNELVAIVYPEVDKISGLTNSQRAAVASLVYNIGRTRFAKSATRRAIVAYVHNSNINNRSLLEKEWKEWRLVDGKVSAGLVKRRQAEIDLFFR